MATFFGRTASGQMVITQIYYNAGFEMAYENDFIVLYNTTNQDIVLDGRYLVGVQNLNGTSWSRNLTGTIQSRRFFLVQYKSFEGGPNLPVSADIMLDPDIPATGTASILDLSNFTYVDNVDFTVGALASNSNDLAIFRKKTGADWQDSASGDGSSLSDFYLSAPLPQNSSFVEKTTPSMTWTNLNAITYPAPLSASQFNATSSVTGTFAYALTNGTAVSTNTILDAGTNRLVASFTPADTNAYNTPAPITNTLVVNKGTPIITWTSPVAITYGTALSGIQNNASSTVAGGFTYNPANGSVLNAGTSSLVVTFTPSDTNYNSPILKTNTLTINKASQTITFGSLAEKVVGDANFNLSASAVSGLAITFASSDSNVVTISGNVVTLVGKGASTITASQAGNTNWNAATNVTQTLTVKSRFAAWSGTEIMTTQSVVLYAIGGASNSSAAPTRPTNNVSGGNLTLTAVVRTNDPKLKVEGEASTDLATWATNTVSSANTTDQTGVNTGHARKTFSVPQTPDGRKFLRLKATLDP